jgi:hypothetical protein
MSSPSAQAHNPSIEGRPPAGFACFRPPFMSNVRRIPTVNPVQRSYNQGAEASFAESAGVMPPNGQSMPIAGSSQRTHPSACGA